LRGSSPLGHGARAEFVLQSGLALNDGEVDDDMSLFSDLAWVGLAQEDGAHLRLGRQQTVAHDYATELELASWEDFGMGALLAGSDDYQMSNVITLQTPMWSGWQAAVSYSHDAAPDLRPRLGSL